MNFEWEDQIPDRVRKTKAYTPGEQRNERGWVKLNTNELPYPPSPAVTPAVTEACADLRLYPDPTGSKVRQALAERHGISADQILLGNGCDDIINIVVRTLTEPGDSIAYLNPSYSLYHNVILNHGAVLHPVEYGQDFAFPAVELASTKAKLMLLTSPNAPSGIAFAKAELEEVLTSNLNPCLIDETYADFSNWTAIDLIRQFPQVIVARSFSKTFGLAGLRFGYLVAHPDLLPFLHRIRDVYNVDRLAQAGALAALEDKAYYQVKHTELLRTRNEFVQVLTERLGWKVFPSSTNFVFTFPRNSQGVSSPEVALELYAFLIARRILVRYFGNHPLVASGLRISIGTPAEMDKLIHTLAQWNPNAKQTS